MKKRNLLLIITVLSVTTLLLTACFNDSSSNVYSDLNEMLKENYTMVNLQVQTTYNGVTLNNVFTSQTATNGTIVTYSVEELATIDKNTNGEYVMPSDMIDKKNGSATIKDGKIVDQTGALVDIPTNNLGRTSLKFKESYFTNVKNYLDNDSVFEAEVVDIASFVGKNNFDGKDMTVTVRYKKGYSGDSNIAGDDINVNISTSKKLSSIVINYTSNNGAQVKIIYSFF